MKTINIEDGQNLVDIAMQEHGTPEAMVTICDDNSLEYDADLSTIQTLAIREPGIDVIPYHNAQVVAEYTKKNAVINSHTDRALSAPQNPSLPCFYGAGAAGLDEGGIKGLNVVFKSTRAATLKFVANMERLYYAYPFDQGALSHIYEPGPYDIVSSFDGQLMNLTIDGVVVIYIVRMLKHDTYLTDADNFILNFV
jgi:hypothetical protein